MLSRLAVWAACVCRALLAGGRSHHRFTGALTPYPASNRRLACHSRAYAFSTCRRIYRPLTVRSATPWCEIVARIHPRRSEEHTSELQSRGHLVCRLLLEKKNVT